MMEVLLILALLAPAIVWGFAPMLCRRKLRRVVAVAGPREFTALGPCPGCRTVAVHLLAADGDVVGRECLGCGHTWAEIRHADGLAAVGQ